MDIPRTAFIPCPIVRFAQVRVVDKCPKCPHFQGVIEVDKSGADFELANRINCAHPIARRMTRIEGV